ncbi:MAG: NADH-ubiquinone oxidoreductase [Rhodospirillales bacterium]|nr:NADH-ubiquinone oxidoreductase [Rhodospirillales bacterium]
MPVPRGPVHVLGATGKCGFALCASLLADGADIVAVVRDRAKWAAMMPGVPARQAALAEAPADGFPLGERGNAADPGLAAALADASLIVSAAHARFVPALLAAAPPAARLVLMGSTRRFTRWPDVHGRGVIAGEVAFLGSGRRGVMLHPTMIYGPPAVAENNIHRLAGLLRRLAAAGRPLAPLPQGGRAKVQPIFIGDVVAALRLSLATAWDRAETLVIAGPEPVSYADFVRAVAAAAGLARPLVLPVPLGLLRALAAAARPVPFLPHLGRDELRRLCEDRAFDITPARRRLGFAPVPLAEGLRRSFQAA